MINIQNSINMSLPTTQNPSLPPMEINTNDENSNPNKLTSTTKKTLSRGTQKSSTSATPLTKRKIQRVQFDLQMQPVDEIDDAGEVKKDLETFSALLTVYKDLAPQFYQIVQETIAKARMINSQMKEKRLSPMIPRELINLCQFNLGNCQKVE